MSEEKDPVKLAEQRGYSRGYQAGRKRVESEDREAARQQRKERFRRQAFLAALPACVMAQNCQDAEGKPINKLPDRVKLAWRAANEAVKDTWF